MIKCGPKRFWGNQPVKGVFQNLVKVFKFHKKATCKINMLKIGDVSNLYTKTSTTLLKIIILKVAHNNSKPCYWSILNNCKKRKGRESWYNF